MSHSISAEQGTPSSSMISTIHFINEDKSITVATGSNLRQKAIENGIDLYTLKGKITNCGGIGQCATCMIAIEEGMDNLSERSDFEQRSLKRKPDNYRLACQTLVQGSVAVKTKPPRRAKG